MNQAACEPKAAPSNLFMDVLMTIGLNLALFPGLGWLAYHNKPFLNGAVVAMEVFFGGVICTLVVGTTGHFMVTKGTTCKTCTMRGNCPFLAIFIVGLVLGTLCVTASHFLLGNADVAFKTFMIVKAVQGLALGVAIPLTMEGLKLIQG